jgi:4-amino-4-deoxy-L-arabinose transferase-like glycosyltransferase
MPLPAATLDDATPARPVARWELPALLLAALALYTANPFGIGLRAVDDCFYARKGVEMARSGAFFTATWNGNPDFQYPSLQFWLLGRSFSLFGENDLAARLPSIAQAIGTLLIVHRLGAPLLGAATATGAVALLAISPYFADHARGCMTDAALGFWVSLTFLLLLEGLRRPRLHLLVALPLGAAILTKSILGLMPLPVFGACLLFSHAWRRALRGPWLWSGIALGLGAGASWSVHQALRFGPEALQAHYGDGIGSLAARPLSLAQRLTRYPVYLFERFQPVILPALAGFALAWRRLRATRDPGVLLLALWIVVPLALFQLSGTQERRYLFPLFPPLALLAAWAIESWSPRAGRWLRRWVAPALLVLATLWLWIAPPRFLNQADPAIAAHRRLLQERIPPDEPLTYAGSERGYWPLANPVLYYVERSLERPAPTAEEAVIRAATRRSRLLLCDRDMLATIGGLAPGARTVVAGGAWVVLDLSGSDPPAAGPRP